MILVFLSRGQSFVRPSEDVEKIEMALERKNSFLLETKGRQASPVFSAFVIILIIKNIYRGCFFFELLSILYPSI